MNLRTLKYFVAIADAGSFTAASAVVCIAQPALTRQLRDLEAEVGTMLLVRGARGVRLTPAGALFYESARRMLAEADRALRDIGGRAEDEVLPVTLGVSPTLARVLLPGVFERCHQRLSGVRLIVREAFTPQLMEWLELGSVDIAVVTNPLPHRALSLTPLLAEPFAVVSPATMGLAPVVALSELGRVPLLMTKLHHDIVRRALSPLRVTANVQAEIDSVDAIRALVLQGKWSTMMPVSVFKASDAAGVQLSEVSGAQINRMLVLAVRAERAKSWSLDVIQEVVSHEAARLMTQGVFSFGKLTAS